MVGTEFPVGVWPTMVTPFTSTGRIDFPALGRLIEWYIDKGVNGLFAVCQSSEMFQLSLEERVSVARFTKEQAGNRVPVIASGHISDALDEQIAELDAMIDTGIDGVVLVTNRLAGPDETDEVWKENLNRILGGIPDDAVLGLYECPYPYKRLLSPALLGWCAGLGRFSFLKDTSCDVATIKDKLRAVSNTGLKVFNANTATLLESLRSGAAGYSGVMANFHPELYVWLVNNWCKNPFDVDNLSNILSMASLIETQSYPMCAKYHLFLEGVFKNWLCRTIADGQFSSTNRLQVEQLRNLSQAMGGTGPYRNTLLESR